MVLKRRGEVRNRIGAKLAATISLLGELFTGQRKKKKEEKSVCFTKRYMIKYVTCLLTLLDQRVFKMRVLRCMNHKHLTLICCEITSF